MSQTETLNLTQEPPPAEPEETAGAAPAPDPEAAEERAREVEDLFLEDVARRSVSGEATLDERLLAISIELGRLPYDRERQVKEGSTASFPYHSIQQIERHLNRMQFKYRLRIVPELVESREVGNTTKLRLRFHARILNAPVESAEVWEWEDDGPDLTKAGSYTQKYGIMKRFHVSDGVDPDEEDGGVKTRTEAPKSRGRKQSEAPREGEPTGSGGTGIEVTPGQRMVLTRLGAVLEAIADSDWWGEPKIEGRIAKLEKDAKAGKLKDGETPYRLLRDEILKSHEKACKTKTCEHQKWVVAKDAEQGW